MEIAGKVFIDATGNADLSVLAGALTVKGRPEDGKCQPMTMNIKLYNVNMPVVRDYIHNHPDDFPMRKGDTSIIDRAPRLSTGGFVSLLKKAQETGEISFPRECVLFFETANPGEVIVNTSRIAELDPTDPFAVSEAEMIGREQGRELLDFVHKYMPGFEEAKLAFTGPEIGRRSSRQLCGAYVLKVEDVLGAGRAISGDFAAQAAFRTTPCAGAVGHAAGAAAALAANEDGDVTSVAYSALRSLLIEQGAFLP